MAGLFTYNIEFIWFSCEYYLSHARVNTTLPEVRVVNVRVCAPDYVSNVLPGY